MVVRRRICLDQRLAGRPTIHLVTGATGLIGNQLVRRLRSQGGAVRALVRSGSDVVTLRQMNVELITGDIGDRDALRRAVEGVTHVYHCAGLVTDWAPIGEFRRVNVDGTGALVDAATTADVSRFVFLSSAAVYGYPPAGVIGECAPMRSRNIPYIQSKISAEQLVRLAIDRRGLAATILRPAMVFGPRCTNYVGEVVRYLRRGRMMLLDHGRHVAGLAYVENVVDAIMLASTHPGAVGEVFNISDASPITWREYIHALADGIGVPAPRRSLPTAAAFQLARAMELIGRVTGMQRRPLLTRLAVLELGQDQRYDITRARSVLGYKPRVAFDQSIQATIKWVNECL